MIISCSSENETDMQIDWQGHRGARGLLPENTVPAFLKALEYPEIMTLELDVAISKDSQIVVSHEPWMNALICSHPNGKPVLKIEEHQLNLYQMDLETIQMFDCGKRGNSRFPEQQAIPVFKPTLSEVVSAVQDYCTKQNRPFPNFNIELKSNPLGDGKFHPDPTRFSLIVVRETERLGIMDQTIYQSFDPRILQALKQLQVAAPLAYLVDHAGSVEQYLEETGFTPDILSPNHKLLNAALVDTLHQEGIKVIPWTVNETKRMKALLDMGVDGIITDYPNRIPT